MKTAGPNQSQHTSRFGDAGICIHPAKDEDSEEATWNTAYAADLGLASLAQTKRRSDQINGPRTLVSALTPHAHVIERKAVTSGDITMMRRGKENLEASASVIANESAVYTRAHARAKQKPDMVSGCM